MTGRLSGTLSGRPVDIRADGRQVVLRVSSLRSAWQLRRSADSVLPLLRFFQNFRLTLQVQIGAGVAINVLPTPAFLLRLLVPALNIAAPGDSP